MFITLDELKTNAVSVVTLKALNNDTSIADEVFSESIETMKDYLFNRYDVEAIFSKTGDDRNKTILKHLKRIAKYEIYKRKNIPVDDDTLRDYDETMMWLRDIAKGIIGLNLPDTDIITGENGDGYLKLKSKPKYSSDF